MDLKIRNAKQQDIDLVLSGVKDTFKIEKHIFGRKEYRENKKLASNAIKSKRIRVAICESIPAGFSWFKFGDLTPFGLDYGKWDRKYCWISWVYMIKKYRNRGIGSLLYEDIAKICKKKGIKQIMLDVYTVNKKSERFHKKRGFKPLLSIFSKEIE